MTDLATALEPVLAEQRRTGVEAVPEWYVYGRHYEIGRCFQDASLGTPLSDDAARMIAEAGIARMLRARGWSVSQSIGAWYLHEAITGQMFHLAATDATHTGLVEITDDLAALIAAALRVYATLPDKPKGGE